MEFEEDFPEFEDDEGRFALMGSELMGGAPLPVNMTPQEKQSYMDGIGIKAKYIGVTEVSSARGGDDVLLAIARVRAAHKAFREAKQRTWLVISVSGLKIRDFDTRQLRDSYALYQISYATWLPSNPQVFAFITANTTTSPPIYKCHVYKSHSKSKMIIETFGRCFTLAVEMQRTGLTRAVRMKDASFHEVVRDIRRQLQSTRVPLDIAAFCNEGLKRLTHLYDQECNSDPHNDPFSPESHASYLSFRHEPQHSTPLATSASSHHRPASAARGAVAYPNTHTRIASHASSTSARRARSGRLPSRVDGHTYDNLPLRERPPSLSPPSHAPSSSSPRTQHQQEQRHQQQRQQQQQQQQGQQHSFKKWHSERLHLDDSNPFSPKGMQEEATAKPRGGGGGGHLVTRASRRANAATAASTTAHSHSHSPSRPTNRSQSRTAAAAAAASTGRRGVRHYPSAPAPLSGGGNGTTRA